MSEFGANIDLTAMKNAVERHLPEEIGEDAMATIAETLREEGREEGRESLRSALRNVLRQRFGAVPGWAEERISGAATGELDGWISRTVVAGSPEEVFGPAN